MSDEPKNEFQRRDAARCRLAAVIGCRPSDQTRIALIGFPERNWNGPGLWLALDAAERIADRFDELTGESEPQAFPDGATAARVVDELRACAALWSPDARLVGNIRAGDIVRAIDELKKTTGKT
jgi:hypothetical protein